jgi:hypothetical protein
MTRTKWILFRVLIVMIVATVGLIILAQTDKPTPPPDVDAAPPSPITQWLDVSQENWRLSIPVANWQPQSVSDPDVKLFLVDDKWVIMLVKQETDSELPDFAANVLRDFSIDGATIYSIYQISLHDQEFVEAEVAKHRAVMWIWMTTKGGYGYGLVCGGGIDPDAGTSMYDMCQSVSNTFHIDQ